MKPRLGLRLRKDAFLKLKTLGEDVMMAIDEKLSSGQPTSAVAEFIQNDLKLLTDDKPESLKKTLERYRANDLKPRMIKRVVDAQVGNRTTSTEMFKRLNALSELERVAALQMARLEKIYATESKSPLLLKSVSDELSLLHNILVNLGKLQLETGILPRAPKKVVGQVVDPDGNVTQFTWSEAQEKLLEELTLIQQEVEDAE